MCDRCDRCVTGGDRCVTGGDRCVTGGDRCDRYVTAGDSWKHV